MTSLTSSSGNSTAQSTSVPAIRNFQFDSEALGNIKDSVNLFRGDVNLPLNLISLTGRNGLDVNVSAVYESNVQNSINTWNLESPTGILGLGWSLGFDKIIADTNNTGSVYDNRYYLVANGSVNLLVRTGTASDGAYTYETQNYHFSRILYYPTQQMWIITQENGITSIYGDKNSDRNTVQWGIKWGNWIGSSALTLGQEKFAKAWNLSETQDTWENSVVFEYDNDNQNVGNNGLQYTRASYLKTITDQFGRTVNFVYANKYGPNNPAPNGAIEYQPPHTELGPNAYQDSYETKYLDVIEVENKTGEFLFSVKFEYELNNLSDTPTSSDLYRYLWKRYLKSIKYVNVDSQSLPGIKFEYFPKTEPHPGALKTITYPEGGKATYSYQKAQLVNSEKNLRINSPMAGSIPRVWYGSDYAVITWYDSGNNRLQLKIYSWTGRWVESKIFYFNAQFDIESLTVIPNQNWFVLAFQNKNPAREEVYLFRQDVIEFGEWSYFQQNISLTSNSAKTILTAGNEFVIVYNPNFSDRPFHGYNWDWKQKAWTTPLLPSLPISNPAQIALAGKGNFYIVCSYNKGTKTGSFQLLYRDDLGLWKQGFTWNNQFDVYQPPNSPNDFLFYWSLGDTYAVATYAKSVSPNPPSLTAQMRVFQWNENFNILNSNSPLVKDYTSPIINQKPLLPVLASIVENSMIGNSQHLLRYVGGSGSSNNVLNWIGKDFDASSTSADYQFGYGSDVAVMSKRSGNNTVNQLLQFNPSNPNQSGWTNPVTLQAQGHYPRGNGNYLNIDNTVYYRQPSGQWQPLSNTLPGSVNGESVQNRAPLYIAYEDQNGQNTKVVPLKNSQLQLVNLTTLSGERIYVDQDNNEGGTNLASFNTLVTYPANQTFDKATYITLYRMAEQTVTGIVHDFQVNYIEIENGFPSDPVYSQFYRYDQSTAIYNSSTAVAQYAKVTVLPGCREDTATPPHGKTEYYYSNGVSRQAGVFYPVGTIYNYAKLLNGILLAKKDYDADGNEVSSVINYWKVLTTRSLLGSSQVANLYGAYSRLEKTISVLDGITQTTENTYDRSTGLITKTTNYNYNSKGQKTVITQSSLYAWQVDEYRQAMTEKNLFSAIVQTTTKTDDTVTLSYVTTWKNWSTDNSIWKWAPHKNYRLQQGTNSPDFNFSNPDLNLWLQLSQIDSVTTNQGQIIEQTDVLGLHESTIYDQTQNNVVATFSNASVAGEQVSYYGFEAYENNQGWQIYPQNQPLQNCSTEDNSGTPCIFSGDAHTGESCLKMPAHPSQRIGLQKIFHLQPGDTEQRYILSCWIKTENGFASENGSAAWNISFVQNGQPVGNPISVEITETNNQWVYIYQIIDLNQQSFNRDAALDIVLQAYNQKQDLYYLIDNIRFSPLLCDFAATVYRSKDWLITAVLGNNGETMRYVYDNFSRQIATIGPTENVDTVTTQYYSRSGNNGQFNSDDPNSSLGISARTGGLYDNFKDGQWQDLWESNNPNDWTVRDSSLIHIGTQLSQITLKGSDSYSNYGAMLKVTPATTMTEVVGLSIGEQVKVQWSPNQQQWQLLVNGNPNPVSSLSSSTLEVTEWLLVVVEKAILFYAGGQQIFSYLLSDNISGALGIFAGNEVKFQDIVVFHEPQMAIAYSDGSGKTKQGQALEGNNSIVSASVYDELGRLAVETKSARYDNTLFGYKSDFVTGVALATTGIMTGYVADYYSANGAGNSDDEGYPYSRTRFENSPLSRQIEVGAPGKDFAIANLNITQPEERHTVKYQYAANEQGGFPTQMNLPAGEYLQTTVTNQDGTISTSIQDQTGNSIADGLEINPINSNYLTTSHDYNYNINGKEVTQKLPNYYNPPEGSQPEQWLISSSYDLLGRLTYRTTPDTSQPFQYIYDQAGKLRFLQDAEGAEKGYVLYTKYDVLGRIIEAGVYNQPWDKTKLQNYANNDPLEPIADKTWLRKYFYDVDDGDDSDANAIGRLTKVLVSKGDAQGTIAVTETLKYNISGNIIRKRTQVSDYSDRNYDIAYTYDNLGNVTEVNYSGTDDNWPKVYYTYNQLNQVTGVGNTPDNPYSYASYSYDATGSVKQESLNNSHSQPIQRAFSYNSPGWLKQINNDVFAETIDYTKGGYNSDGSENVGYYSGKIARITSAFELSNPNNFTTNFSYQYQYDRAGRLQVAQNVQNNQPFLPYSVGLSPQGPTSYDYDGNIQQLDRGNSNSGSYSYQTYSYPQGSNQIQSLSVQTDTGTNVENFTPDGNGNITAVSGKFQDLRYNRLTQMTDSITTVADPNNPITFTYGGNQQRVLKQQSDHQKLYLHGGNSYPLIELDKTAGGSENVTFYIYGPTGLIAFARNATQESTNYLYVLKDHQSSTRAVVDGDTNSVLLAYNYLPFGDSMGEVYGSSVLAYLYTGQEYDTETGLYNYRARFYDSGLGRFYGPDPAGQQPSPFAYAGNDPILFSDKTGSIFGIDDLLIGLAIGALIGAAIGAVAGGISYAVTHSNDFSVGDFFKNIGIGALTGAVSGAVGFGVGAGVSSAVTAGVTTLSVSAGQSVITSVASGVISGAVGGAAASVSGQLLNNALTGQSLGAGLGEAALTGALIGGITGGIGGAFAARAAGSSSIASSSETTRNPFLRFILRSGPKTVTNGFREGGGTAFAGHGGFRLSYGFTRVPEGTSITLYSRLGSSISDRLGLAIENGTVGTPVQRGSGNLLAYLFSPFRNPVTYRSGDLIPNYALHPPEGLNILSSSVTVNRTTNLNQLLRPNMGNVHWAACTAYEGRLLRSFFPYRIWN